MKNLRIALQIVASETFYNSMIIRTFNQRGIKLTSRLDKNHSTGDRDLCWVRSVSDHGQMKSYNQSAYSGKPSGRVVNTYNVTREFGGHEEGGWGYDKRILVASKTFPNSRLANHRMNVLRRSIPTDKGRGYSDLRTIVVVENRAGESATITRPHYE